MVEGFFNLDLMNKLPLEIFAAEQADFEDNESEIEKRVTSGVRCFWCYELAKRQGLDPDGAIKRNSYGDIEWIFHCPIDPATGKLCCPKLLEEDSPIAKQSSGIEQYDVKAVAVPVESEREPVRA